MSTDDSFFEGVDVLASPLAELIDITLAACTPPEELNALEIPAYLMAVIKHGLHAVRESEDALATVRADANSAAWAKLRDVQQPLIGWLYSPDGPAALRNLAADVQLSPLTVLSFLASHLWTAETPAGLRPTSNARNVIAVGLGLALALSRRDPELAAEVLDNDDLPSLTIDGSEHSANGELAARVRAVLKATLMDRLIALGEQEPRIAGDVAESTASIYYGTCRTIPEPERLRMVQAIEMLACRRQISPMALYVFVSTDFSDLVVSSAALAMAQVLVTTTDPILGGVPYLAEQAKSYADEGVVNQDVRAAAVLSGLVLLGDRRVLELLGPCWRWLAHDGRRALSSLSTAWVYAAVVDWLLDWLEDCEGEEFGAVAGTLARFGTIAMSKGVIDVQRTFPVWSAPDGQVVTITAQWTAAEYAERLRPKILGLAGRESHPKVMPEVLRCWGIADWA